MFRKIREALSPERRAERAERHRLSREADQKSKVQLASDAHTQSVREGLGNRSPRNL